MERVCIDCFEVNLKSALRNLKSAILLGALLDVMLSPLLVRYGGPIVRNCKEQLTKLIETLPRQILISLSESY